MASMLGWVATQPRTSFFREWKRLDEDEPGVVDMETLLKGSLHQIELPRPLRKLRPIRRQRRRLIKVIAQNQQYLGVNRAIQSIEARHSSGGKLGVFWHTQGAGKSYSMVFFSRKGAP